jgi:hypothetical protein
VSFRILFAIAAGLRRLVEKDEAVASQPIPNGYGRHIGTLCNVRFGDV